MIDFSNAVIFHAVINDKKWRMVSTHGSPTHRWAWLVNIDNPAEQVRLSMRSPELRRYANR
jgi:hypothetical protein